MISISNIQRRVQEISKKQSDCDKAKLYGLAVCQAGRLPVSEKINVIRMNAIKFLVSGAICILLVVSCTKYDINPPVKASISVLKTEYNVLEQVNVKNNGTGEYFVFWPGDYGHNYSKRSDGNQKGIAPNNGNDFSYSYIATGTYTIVLVASSYDEENNVRTEKVDSLQITIVTGNSGNVIESIELYNCLSGYNSVGQFFGTDSILFPIGFLNRPKGVDDSTFIEIINGRSFIYNASSFSKVYGDNDVLLTNTTEDTYKSNLIEATNYSPLITRPRIKNLKVVSQDGISRYYTIAAMLHPEFFSFSVPVATVTRTALMYSSNGVTVDTTYKAFQNAYPDSVYFGLRTKSLESSFTAIPTFTVTQGTKVYLNGIEQVSGITPVLFTKGNKLYYIVVKEDSGFIIKTKVGILVL